MDHLHRLVAAGKLLIGFVAPRVGDATVFQRVQPETFFLSDETGGQRCRHGSAPRARHGVLADCVASFGHDRWPIRNAMGYRAPLFLPNVIALTFEPIPGLP